MKGAWTSCSQSALKRVSLISIGPERKESTNINLVSAKTFQWGGGLP